MASLGLNELSKNIKSNITTTNNAQPSLSQQHQSQNNESALNAIMLQQWLDLPKQMLSSNKKFLKDNPTYLGKLAQLILQVIAPFEFMKWWIS